MPAIFLDRSIGVPEELHEDDTYVNEEEVVMVLCDWASEILEGISGQQVFHEFRFLFPEEHMTPILRVYRHWDQNETVVEVLEQGYEKSSCLFWIATQ